MEAAIVRACVRRSSHLNIDYYAYLDYSGHFPPVSRVTQTYTQPVIKFNTNTQH